MRLTAVSLIILLFSCSIAAEAEESMFVRFHGTALESGRALWLDNCKGCHAYGVADAPIPMQAEQWQARVVKDRQVLYTHAISGFFGPNDTMMPERGGNPELTDEQVRLAVDYMVELAKFYIKQQAIKHK